MLVTIVHRPLESDEERIPRDTARIGAAPGEYRVGTAVLRLEDCCCFRYLHTNHACRAPRAARTAAASLKGSRVPRTS